MKDLKAFTKLYEALQSYFYVNTISWNTRRGKG